MKRISILTVCALFLSLCVNAQEKSIRSKADIIPPFNVLASFDQDSNADIHWQIPYNRMNDTAFTFMKEDGRGKTLLQQITGLPDAKYAIKMIPSNFASNGITQNHKIIKVSFENGDPTASYVVEVKQGESMEDASLEVIYRKDLPIQPTGVIEVLLDTALSFDHTKSLWFVVTAKKGYKGMPVVLDSAAVVVGQSSLFYMEETGDYRNLADVASIYVNLNFTTKAYFSETSSVSDLLGYDLYRLKSADTAVSSRWTKLNTSTLSTTSFKDATMSSQPYNVYKYAARAVYTGGTSDAAFSNNMEKDMYVPFTVKIVTIDDNIPLDGIAVTLSIPGKNYVAVTGETGNAFFSSVFRSSAYTLTVKSFGRLKKDTIIKNVNITAPKIYELKMVPNMFPPSNVKMVVKGKDANLSWGIPEANAETILENCTTPVGNIPNLGNSSLEVGTTYDKLRLFGIDQIAGVRFKSTDAASYKFVVKKHVAGNSYQTVYESYIGQFSQNQMVDVTLSNPYVIDTTVDEYFFGVGISNISKSTIPVEVGCQGSLHKNLIFISEEVPPATINYDWMLAFKGLTVYNLIPDFGYDLYLDGEIMEEAIHDVKYVFPNLSLGNHNVGIIAMYETGASEEVTKFFKITNDTFDIKVAQILYPVSKTDFGLNKKVKVRVENHSNVVAKNIPVSYRLQRNYNWQGDEITEEIPGPIAVGGSLEYEFESTISIFASSSDRISLFAYTKLEEDLRPENDTAIAFLAVANQEGLETKLAIYPNPTKGILHVQGEVQIESYRVYNLIGQLILQQTVKAKDFECDLTHLKQGVYLIELNTTQGRITKRITRQ